MTFFAYYQPTIRRANRRSALWRVTLSLRYGVAPFVALAFMQFVAYVRKIAEFYQCILLLQPKYRPNVILLNMTQPVGIGTENAIETRRQQARRRRLERLQIFCLLDI